MNDVNLEVPPKRRGRGPGKRPALVLLSVRVSRPTMEFFNANYPSSKQAAMRRALEEFVEHQLKQKELQDGTQEVDQE